MSLVSFHINGAEGTCRTKVLACATSYAALGVDNRYIQLLLATVFQGHHLYGSGGTMALAIATRLAVAYGDAVLPDPHGMTYLYGGFLLACNGSYGTCRTNVGTPGTFWAAISTLIGHLGLHKP